MTPLLTDVCATGEHSSAHPPTRPSPHPTPLHHGNTPPTVARDIGRLRTGWAGTWRHGERRRGEGRGGEGREGRRGEGREEREGGERGEEKTGEERGGKERGGEEGRRGEDRGGEGRRGEEESEGWRKVTSSTAEQKEVWQLAHRGDRG